MAYRKPIEAAEQYLGAERPISIDPADVGVGRGDIEVIDRPLNADKLETERFMQDMLTIIVHDSNDDADDEIVETWVNGRAQRFLRGREQQVRRCYVEALARSKRTTYKQKLDHRLGEAGFNMMHPHHALRYPFSVISDPSPKGREWLVNVLAQRT